MPQCTAPFNRFLTLLCAAALALVQTAPAVAAGPRLQLIRDAEIEGLLEDYTQPLFKAGGLGKRAVEVFIVSDDRFNAFVAGRRMFINTGALKIAETPGEIIGVLAHETGHVTGGHQFRLQDRLEKASVLSILTMLAGVGAVAAGRGGGAGGALALGAQSAIQRDLLAYQRSEETAADIAALRLLEKTGTSPRGMLRTFERLDQQALMSGRGIDPYMQSHPLPRERVETLASMVRGSARYERPEDAGLSARHAMVRAKIAAYEDNTGLLNAMFRNDPRGPAMRYGLAISYHRRGASGQALELLDKLVKEQPRNPYLHEMRGEVLLAAGRAREAMDAFGRAIKLDRHSSGLLRVALGHAMLQTGEPALVARSASEIRAGIARDPDNAAAYGLLARAQAAQGEPDLARAAAAQEAFHAMDFKRARQLATMAQPKLKTGSPDWLRMQDIIDYKPPKTR